MSDLGNIVKKEVKELLTLKTMVPIIALTLMFGLIGQSIGEVAEKAEEKPIVGIIDGDDSSLSRKFVRIFENGSEVVYFSKYSGDTQEALEQLKENEGVSLLVIPSGFSENISRNLSGSIQVRWIMKGVGAMESIPVEAVNGLIRIARERISRTLIEKTGQIEPNLALRPVKKSETTFLRGNKFAGVSPGEISGALSSQSTLVPMVIMIIILMSGGQVIQSMGMEKGNKTLETLLTLPVRRSHIAIGKITGSAVVGLLMASIYMIGFGYYMQSFRPQAVSLAEAELALGALDYLLLGVSLFLTIVAGLSICMLLGTFAEDYGSVLTFVT